MYTKRLKYKLYKLININKNEKDRFDQKYTGNKKVNCLWSNIVIMTLDKYKCNDMLFVIRK